MHNRIHSYLQKLTRQQQQSFLRELKAQSVEGLAKSAQKIGVTRDELVQALPELESLVRTGAAKYGERAAATPMVSLPKNVSLGQFRYADFAPEGKSKLAALSRDHAFAGEFPVPQNQGASVQALRDDLAEVAASGGGTVLDKIDQHPLLSAQQKERVFFVLAEVRDSYLAKIQQAKDSGSPVDYQMVNWKHTRAEVDFVMASAEVNGLNANQVEDALLASIFSDAIKTPQNFITHNLDGAAAAAEVLPRYFDTTSARAVARMEGIIRAVEEHQIGPPSFMGNIITRGMLTGHLSAALSATETGRAVMEKVGNPFAFSSAHRQECLLALRGPGEIRMELGGQAISLKAGEADVLRGALSQAAARDSAAQKIANPFASAGRSADGQHQVQFSSEEREVLAQIGIEHWAVPDPESDHYAVSRAVIDGDSMVNYATPEGFAKIVAIRGPGTSTFFMDSRLGDSLESARQSYADAFAAMTPKGQELAEAQKQKTEALLSKVDSELRDWLSQQADVPKNKDGTIAFLDVPLRYPPGNDASRINELSPTEQAQFIMAGRIRNKAVELLQAAHAAGVA